MKELSDIDKEYLNKNLSNPFIQLDIEEKEFFLSIYAINKANLNHKSLLCQLNYDSDILKIYPLNTTNYLAPDFLSSKYSKLRLIELEGFDFNAYRDPIHFFDLISFQLPWGFLTAPLNGLGITSKQKAIIDVLESADIEIFRISKFEERSIILDKTYIIPFFLFDKLRKKTNNISEKYRQTAFQEKLAYANNELLSTLDPQKYPVKHPKYQKDTFLNIINNKEVSYNLMSNADKKSVIELVKNNTKNLLKDQAQELLTLKENIEIINLEQIIMKFETMIKQDLSENRWQTFLENNSFILSLAFGYPVIIIQEQACIGGKKINNKGEKITDFLAQTQGTGNAVVIEIKTPKSNILMKKQYRQGIYAASSEFSGAISQCLEQCYQLQKNISKIKDESELPNLQAYAVQCVLIIGMLPIDRETKKSLELVRQAIHGVSIITFDEVLEKLKTLLTLLKDSNN